MTATEMFKKVEEVKAIHEDNYYYFGIRFEDKLRNINELITDCSKSNYAREDARVFPDYESDEYNTMEELNGVCAYGLNSRIGWTPLTSYYKEEDITDVTKRYLSEHCYILGSNRVEYGEDENEIVMIESTVLEIIF